MTYNTILNKAKSNSEKIKDHSGSIVVMSIETGEILSLVSNPTFNSNDFVKEMHPDK